MIFNTNVFFLNTQLVTADAMDDKNGVYTQLTADRCSQMSSEFLLFIEKMLAVEIEESTSSEISPNHADVLEFLQEYVDDNLFSNIPGRYWNACMHILQVCFFGFVADHTSTFLISNLSST
jgi:hypothetical protein